MQVVGSDIRKAEFVGVTQSSAVSLYEIVVKLKGKYEGGYAW